MLIPPSIVSKAVQPITAIYPKLWFNKIPEPARFVTSAGIGNIIFFYIDIILYDLVIHPLSLQDFSKKINGESNIGMKMLLFLLPPKSVLQKNKESISFFVSYLIQILAQHFLNAFFVYGLETISTKDKYMSTLFVTYSSYFVSLIGSTICNITLLRKGMSKNVAFWGTVIGFGFFNYIALKFLIGSQNQKQSDDITADGETDKKIGSRAKRSFERNNKNNRDGKSNSDNSDNNNIRNRKKNNGAMKKMRGGENNSDNNNTRNRKMNNGTMRKMRGGGHISRHNSVNIIMMRMLNELNLLLEGLKANSSSYDHHVAFVKSVGQGIELNQKM